MISISDTNDMIISDVTPKYLSTNGDEIVIFSGVELGPKDVTLSDATTVTATYAK